MSSDIIFHDSDISLLGSCKFVGLIIREQHTILLLDKESINRAQREKDLNIVIVCSGLYKVKFIWTDFNILP
jgi:hypothetical protein